MRGLAGTPGDCLDPREEIDEVEPLDELPDDAGLVVRRQELVERPGIEGGLVAFGAAEAGRGAHTDGLAPRRCSVNRQK